MKKKRILSKRTRFSPSSDYESGNEADHDGGGDPIAAGIIQKKRKRKGSLMTEVSPQSKHQGLCDHGDCERGKQCLHHLKEVA